MKQISLARWSERNLKYLLLIPTVALLLILTVYPLIYAVVASLHTINIRTGEQSFIGLKNFVAIATDKLFWNALKNTAVYTGVGVTLEFFFGLGLAMFLSTKLVGRNMFRALLLTPMMLPPIVVAVIFKIIYIPDFGIINWLLGLVGIEGIIWEASVKTALPSLILVDIWEWTPFMFLILLAGLQAIPVDPYEAAMVDGASQLQVFRHITIPLLTPAILIALLLRLMDTLRIFDQVFIMTGGGPANATETMSLYIYRHGFRFSNIGYATAMSFIMLILTVMISNFFINRLKAEEIFTQ
ncbi:MAG: sugar ABC transporter permease [Planctomycetes bacterium]|nr:sugar ABC transporter permease [Planctomycetota bacterium]